MHQRKFPRFAARVKARFLVNHHKAGSGEAIDISAGGLKIRTEMEVEIGDSIIFHFDGGGRLEGKVARLCEDGFGVALLLSDVKQKRLADCIASRSENLITEVPMERRVSVRENAFRTETTCKTADGEFLCRIVDMSLSGVAFETDADIPIGSLASIGRIDGRIVRKDDDIYGLEFHTFANGVATTIAPIREKKLT